MCDTQQGNNFKIIAINTVSGGSRQIYIRNKQ